MDSGRGTFATMSSTTSSSLKPVKGFHPTLGKSDSGFAMTDNRDQKPAYKQQQYYRQHSQNSSDGSSVGHHRHPPSPPVRLRDR